MKGAANCRMRCDLQNAVSQQQLERAVCFCDGCNGCNAEQISTAPSLSLAVEVEPPRARVARPSPNGQGGERREREREGEGEGRERERGEGAGGRGRERGREGERLASVGKGSALRAGRMGSLPRCLS